MKNKNPNTKQFWDRLIVTSKKNLFKSQIYIHKNNIVLRYLKNISGRLLDVGIGYGYIEHLLQKSDSKLSFYGIDISKKSIGQLNKKFKGEFKIANTTKIPFPNSFFEVAIVLDVLEHLNVNNALKTYKEIFRILKPQGLLIISVPLNDSPKDKKLNGHVREYSPEIIEREILQNGFSIKKRHLLYAFRSMYFLKTIFVNLIPFPIKKPNLIILVAQKI